MQEMVLCSESWFKGGATTGFVFLLVLIMQFSTVTKSNDLPQ
jgi:hypothetical protein